MAGPKYIMPDMVYMDKMRDILSRDLGKGSDEPSQVLPHVLLGSQRNAESLRLLRKYGVTHVLNCAGFKGPKLHPEITTPYDGLDIDYLEIKADDADTYDITQHFPEAFAYLDQVKRCKGVCLVHCALGINRSAAVCVAYAMYAKTWTLLRVVRALKPGRRVMLSNEGFRRQLIRYARMKSLLDPLPKPETEEEVAIKEVRKGRSPRSSARRDYEDMLYGWRIPGFQLRDPVTDEADDQMSRYSQESTARSGSYNGTRSYPGSSYNSNPYSYSLRTRSHSREREAPNVAFSLRTRSNSRDREPTDVALNFLYDRFLNRDKV